MLSSQVWLSCYRVIAALCKNAQVCYRVTSVQGIVRPTSSVLLPPTNQYDAHTCIVMFWWSQSLDTDKEHDVLFR